MINEVLKGITDALYAAFGDNYEIHTEASMQDMEEPAFFVRCINPDVPRGLTGRRKATLLFIVQYFPESDEPKKEINTVYERLSECLDLIEVEGKMVRGTIECKDISDDVMSATAEYTLFLGQSQKDAVNKVTYTKEQIIGSKKYAGRADLLSALLEPGKSYTLEEVDKKMEKYMKGAVR